MREKVYVLPPMQLRYSGGFSPSGVPSRRLTRGSSLNPPSFPVAHPEHLWNDLMTR
ncbi:hypothetical protein LKK83_09810 [Phormidium sp. CCY1219]|nr:hypothetical protein [Phormidium sp. CCY1219]